MQPEQLACISNFIFRWKISTSKNGECGAKFASAFPGHRHTSPTLLHKFLRILSSAFSAPIFGGCLRLYLEYISSYVSLVLCEYEAFLPIRTGETRILFLRAFAQRVNKYVPAFWSRLSRYPRPRPVIPAMSGPTDGVFSIHSAPPPSTYKARQGKYWSLR